MGSAGAIASPSIAPSWKELSAGSCFQEKLSTTKTVFETTIVRKIWSCGQAGTVMDNEWMNAFVMQSSFWPSTTSTGILTLPP